jgi:hypothetical protein
MKAITMIVVTAMLMASVMAQDEDAVLGVVIGKSGFQCGKNCAIGADGVAVYGDGRGNYITSKGFAYKSGTDYVASSGTYVTESNGWFYGSKYAIPAGMAYMNGSSTFVGTQNPVKLRRP